MTLELLQVRGRGELWASVAPSLEGAPPAEGALDEGVLRVRRAVTTQRVLVEREAQVIVKIWPDLNEGRNLIKDAIWGSRAYRSWAAPRLLVSRGVATAPSIAYFRYRRPDGEQAEAVVQEDLGECEGAHLRLQQYLREDDDAGVRAMERGLAQITASMLASGFIDMDNLLWNFSLAPEGRLVRLDLEWCYRLGRAAIRCFPRLWGDMLGALIGTYAFAVQPRTELALRFAEVLADATAPSRRARKLTGIRVNAMMNRQRMQRGIDTHVALEW